MAAGAGLVFVNSSVIGSAAIGANGIAGGAYFEGGFSQVVIAATQFGNAVGVQFQAGNGTWIPICSSFVANQLFPFTAPQGQYRLVQNGSSIGMFASIARIIE